MVWSNNPHSDESHLRVCISMKNISYLEPFNGHLREDNVASVALNTNNKVSVPKSGL